MESNSITLEQFHKYFKNKKVAVVANSNKLLDYEYGDYIDSHDIVIRFNSFKLIPKHTGAKTNIHAAVFLNKENYEISCDYRIIYGSGLDAWERGRRLLQPNKQMGVLNYVHTPHYKLFLDYPAAPMAPTTGFYVLTLLEKFGECKEINLFGFTFYEKGKQDILRKDNIPTDIYKDHAYGYEKTWVLKRYTQNPNFNQAFKVYNWKPKVLEIKKPKFSIVMSYCNRRQLLLNTLKTIQRSSKVKELEVVITDDGSGAMEYIFDLQTLFNFPIEVIRVEPEDKWYSNPCVPYNMAIKRAKGDMIIIQNPEVLHTADILKDVEKRLTDKNYLAYAVFAVNDIMTAQISALKYDSYSIFEDIQNVIAPVKDTAISVRNNVGWYNHSVHRPVALHFLCAITKTNMDKLKGFDERYAYGVDYDDNEFLHRVRRNELNVIFVDNPIGIHQNHPKIAYDKTMLAERRQRNKDLYYNVTLNETKWSTFDVSNIKVSIIVPYLNNHKTIQHSLDSVFKQTHKNIEVIVVGNLPRNDKEVVKLFENQQPIIYYPVSAATSVSELYNFAISKVTGNYTAILSPGDYMLPSKIEQQTKFMVHDDLNASYVPLTTERGVLKLSHIVNDTDITLSPFMFKTKFLIDSLLRFSTVEVGSEICFIIDLIGLVDVQILDIVLVRKENDIEKTDLLPRKEILKLSTLLQHVLNNEKLHSEYKEIGALCSLISTEANSLSNAAVENKKQEMLPNIKETIDNGTETEINGLYEKIKKIETEKQSEIEALSKKLQEIENQKTLVEMKLQKFIQQAQLKKEELESQIVNLNKSIKEPAVQKTTAPPPPPLHVNKRHPAVRFHKKPIHP